MSIAKHQSPNANPVTREEVNEIERLVIQGLKDPEIARVMGSTESRVRIAIHKNTVGRKKILAKAGK